MKGYTRCKGRYIKLKAAMLEKGYRQADLAKAINITTQSLNAKLNERAEFSINEAQQIADILQLKDPAEIFFQDSCTSCK